MSLTGTVYLLHFASPVRGKRHYVGFTQNLSGRLHDHGGVVFGSAITKLALKHHVRVVLGRVWENVEPDHEHRLKREKNLKRHCFACSGLPSIVVCEGASGTEGATVLVPPKAG